MGLHIKRVSNDSSNRLDQRGPKIQESGRCLFMDEDLPSLLIFWSQGSSSSEILEACVSMLIRVRRSLRNTCRSVYVEACVTRVGPWRSLRNACRSVRGNQDLDFRYGL